MSQLSTASAGWPSPSADTCLRVHRRQEISQAAAGTPIR
jgi:hypothetical protein